MLKSKSHFPAIQNENNGFHFPLFLAELCMRRSSGLVAGELSLLGRLQMKDSRPCCGLRVPGGYVPCPVMCYKPGGRVEEPLVGR